MIFGKFKLKTSKDEIRNCRFITIHILLCRGKNGRIKLKKKEEKIQQIYLILFLRFNQSQFSFLSLHNKNQVPRRKKAQNRLLRQKEICFAKSVLVPDDSVWLPSGLLSNNILAKKRAEVCLLIWPSTEARKI